MRYRADITAGALKLHESRIIADLLLQEPDESRWKQAIVTDNVLQARSPQTAKRLVSLIRGRLGGMTAGLWRMVRDGSNEEATHALLAAAVKHSTLLGDFLDQVVREQYAIFSPALSKILWPRFIEDCAGRDPGVDAWSESTVNHLRRTVFQILAQAGYIDNVRAMNLQTLYISTPVIAYLEDHDEPYVLRCIKAGQ